MPAGLDEATHHDAARVHELYYREAAYRAPIFQMPAFGTDMEGFNLQNKLTSRP